MNNPAEPPGVVVDCMVFVQAAAKGKSPAAHILDLLDEGKITLYVSKLILAEARYVLNRSDVRRISEAVSLFADCYAGKLFSSGEDG